MSAAVYAQRLRAEMKRRHITSKWLSEEARVSRTYVSELRNGHSVPCLGTSQRVAEALGAPVLHEYIISLRERSCPVCDRRFISDHKVLARETYCTSRCADTARQRQNTERAATMRRGLAQLRAYRLELYQKGVDAYCRDCEPGGLCLTPACPLREVSPLPLSREAVA